MKTVELLPRLKELLPDLILEEKEFLGEVTLQISKENLKRLLLTLKQTPDFGYEVLNDLTGVDYLEPKRTQLIYWLHNPDSLERIRVTLYAEREELVPSVVDIWEGANWYERELFDLFGVRFDGHPNLKRILMPDNWKGHPLRKDYALTEEPVEFKHGVKPKVPSQIIPHIWKR
jgi:NADH-quinone oxidoreductase subunit C